VTASGAGPSHEPEPGAHTQPDDTHLSEIRSRAEATASICAGALSGDLDAETVLRAALLHSERVLSLLAIVEAERRGAG
jgi:hypothetical protein